MTRVVVCVLALVLSALSLAPSFAHVPEAGPRLTTWSPELWRETTVFNRQFERFARIGAPIDVAAIVCAAVLAYLVRDVPHARWFGYAGVALLVLGLALWFVIVARANAVLATWHPGPIPSDFETVRTRWELGHMSVAMAKGLGFISICLAQLLWPRLP